jgi:hypothetical protein
LEVGAAESSEAKVREANFNETLLKHGIERIVNRVEEDPTGLRSPAFLRVKRWPDGPSRVQKYS